MSDTATCRRVVCCGVNGVQFNDFIYSLVLGESYTNPELSFTINCPPGYDCTADSVVVVIPPGTIKFTPTVLDPNPPNSGSGDPWNPISGTYNFDCGSETLTIRTDGTGFTNDQIDQIINFLAQCQANKDGNDVLLPTPIYTPSGAPGIRLWNTEQSCTATCPEGETGDPVTVTIPANTNSTIIAASSTPLERYLAQQALNTAAYDQACAQAESEISCAGPECPIFANTVTGMSGICIQTAYDSVNDWIFAGDFSDQVVRKIDPATNAVVASSASFGDVVKGLVYVPGPTTVDANPAIIVTAGSNLYHLDPTTMAITLLTALSAASTAGPMAYGSATHTVAIPIENSPFGVDFWQLSLGVLNNIPGNSSSKGLVYNSNLGKFYCGNFDGVTYPGVDMIVLDEASQTISDTFSISDAQDVASNQPNWAYCPTSQQIYIGTHNTSNDENKVYIVDAATLTEEASLLLSSFSGLLNPFVVWSEELGIIIAGVTAPTLDDSETVAINPLDDSLICTIVGTKVHAAGCDVASRGAYYTTVRRTVDDLTISEMTPP